MNYLAIVSPPTIYQIQWGQPQHQHLPSLNLTMTTKCCNHSITCGFVPVRLPTTVDKVAPNRITLPPSANFFSKKNKPTASSTQPAVRRSNIGTSYVAPTATHVSRP